MKPWEETWRRGNAEVGEDWWSVYDQKGGVVCERFISSDDAEITVAAPRLYRALEALAALYDTDEGCRALPEYTEARAALKAARGEAPR